MKIWLNLIIRTSSKGFTLLELLLASIMTFFVVSATGYAVLVMTQQSMVSEVASDTQSNLNRAMDFIADEVKSADTIEYPTSTIYTNPNTATGNNFSLPAGATVVLALNKSGLTNSSGTPRPIIYYIKPTPTPNTEVWLGPNVIYRWGPSLSATGAYTNPDKAGETPANNGWRSDALVDAIADSSFYTSGGSNIAYTGINEQGQKKCPAGGTATTGWTAIPNTSSGFFACVKNDGSQAEIHAYSSLATELSNRGIADSTNANNRNTDRATYGVVTFVYPRSTAPIIVSSTTATAISQPAQASLTATGCSGSLTVNSVNSSGATITNPTSPNWDLSLTSTFQKLIYPASPTSSAALTISGMTYSNTNTTDNVVTFTNGSCIVTASLNTP